MMKSSRNGVLETITKRHYELKTPVMIEVSRETEINEGVIEVDTKFECFNDAFLCGEIIDEQGIRHYIIQFGPDGGLIQLDREQFKLRF